MLRLQHNTIGKVNPGAGRLTPLQRTQNSAAAYAEHASRQSLHRDGTLTEHTIDNSATYSAIPGLDDGRPIFAIVAFVTALEGVFSITSEGKVFPRVPPHLLRYVLLDVDRALPAPKLNPDT